MVQLIGWYVLAVNTNGLTLEEVALLFEEPGGAVPDVEHAATVAHRTLIGERGTKLKLDDDESLESPASPAEDPLHPPL